MSLATLKVMFVGDSITSGLNSANPGGYRAELFDKIARRIGYTPVTTGWSTNGAAGDASRWCGLSGERTDECRTRTVVQAPAFKPDVVFLHIGTNDTTQLANLGGPNTVAQSMGYLTSILNDFRGANSECVVFVCKIIDQETYPSAIIAYNNALVSTVQARADYVAGKIVIVDMYTAMGAYSTINYLSGDPTHPREAGYSLMANAYYTAFVTKGF
jgi:lysophospholipase L1-like esterase